MKQTRNSLSYFRLAIFQLPLFLVLVIACQAVGSSKTGPIFAGLFLQEEMQSEGQRSSSSSSDSITGSVLDEGGHGVPFARVLIAGLNPAAAPDRSSRTSTDSEGRFAVTGLSAGAYIVDAYAPGYANEQFAAGENNRLQYFRPGDAVTIRLMKGCVITGTVTDGSGKPVVAIPIKVIRTRDENGKALPVGLVGGGAPSGTTDDRGVYRIYGLLPGSYVIATGYANNFGMMPSAYSGKAPTYYSSSTRDTAVEVVVRRGEEKQNVDIRYRGEAGHTVSGIVEGVTGNAEAGNLSVQMGNATTGEFEMWTIINAFDKLGFSFHGVADGAYELTATKRSAPGEGPTGGAASAPLKVTVRGGDVTGVKLTLAPLGEVRGSLRLAVDTSPAGKSGCSDQPSRPLEESVIILKREGEGRRPLPMGDISPPRVSVTPDVKGDFQFRNLRAGKYYFEWLFPDESWYLSATGTDQKSGGGGRQSNAGFDRRFVLPQGKIISGLSLTVKTNGAQIHGKVSAAGGAAPRSEQLLRVYLVPAEKESAEDVLRYAEAEVKEDGAFEFLNLAPGKYWAIANTAEGNKDAGGPPRFLDAEERAVMRAAAERAGQKVELSPCQLIENYNLKLSH